MSWRAGIRADQGAAARACGTWISHSSVASVSGGSRRAEFRAEAFNITNSPHWRSPLGTNTTTDTGGTINVTDANFGRNFNVYGERQIRLGLRFSF